MTPDSGPESFGEWDVRSLRLSVFSTEDPPTGLWSQVTETEPEAIDQRPRERTVTETGQALGNVLQVITQPKRVDWLFQPTVLPTTEGLHLLSSVPESMSTLRRSLDMILGRVSHVDRLAFGVSLIKQAGSQREGVQALAAYLSHLPLTGDIRDFAYRVNRRRRLQADPRIEVNRVAGWSVEEIIRLGVAIPQGRVDLGAPDVVRKLLLDINTVPTGARTSDKARPWFDELVDMAIEIAVEGDVE